MKVLLTVMLVTLVHLPLELAAQAFSVSGLQTWADHDRLGTPRGYAVELGYKLRGRLGLRFGYEHLTDNFDTFGNTCFGLIDPQANCGPEVRREDSHLEALVLSLPVTVVSGQQFQVEVVPGLRTVHIEHGWSGANSRNVSSNEKRMSGPQFGAEINYAPLQRLPLRLHAAYHMHWLNLFKENMIVDGFAPFERDIRMDVIKLGVSVIIS